jgi:hypothetical protein
VELGELLEVGVVVQVDLAFGALLPMCLALVGVVVGVLEGLMMFYGDQIVVAAVVDSLLDSLEKQHWVH